MTYDFLEYLINQDMILVQILTLFAVAFIAFKAIFDFYGITMVLYNWLKMEDIKGSYELSPHQHVKVLCFYLSLLISNFTISVNLNILFNFRIINLIYLYLGQEILRDEKLSINSADYLLEDYVTFKDSGQSIVLAFPTIIMICFILSVYLTLQGKLHKLQLDCFMT